MAKKITENGCVAKCDKVGDKRECNIMVPIYGSSNCRPRTRDEFEATITIGCLKGHYDSARRRCKKGTRALKMTL
jgi:hypothetical protein